MSTSITTHTATSLNELTLNTITTINNHFANMVGAKQTKRFGTKPAAVKKCLINQAEFNVQFPVKVEPVKVEETPVVKTPSVKVEAAPVVKTTPSAKPTKEKVSRFNTSLGLELCVDFESAKKGTLKHTIFKAIQTYGGDEEGNVLNTISDIIFEIVRAYNRPRSEKTVDEAFAIRKIKRLIKKGDITIAK